ncbi:lysine N(6)-hydroxylase/L-ornithine N(5)-oxygenase family protein [Hoyosella sp. YIM 151337]|uniref:lysine N(6)-hydroxylase/L-ornithine N(5)-oxygenase family protein n=1 Tax=Hoyosella sp. YIM 151337 TaxID=2992742 RepID=UPI0022364714|nr:lysine N(6)-hydroxylase/L-ornithine N(5)-oxygenase family protein [Hoyosella sp. YIM 151337]MCW4354195.1 lysine N(6)-hydroxylase/L-ornithine N(5)-oxygenase family protein [Hoyosella sp. YIM 151337]
MSVQAPAEYDLAGIGFGPSNLALAIAIEEHNHTAAEPLRAVFFERQQRFGWHRGMLLDGTTMQVAFPKDLATFRNPTSAFTFFSYLHDRNRLADFVNHQTFFPSRKEFHNYLEWAAGKVDADVRYGTAVNRVTPTSDGTALRIDTDGTPVIARNVVAALGLRERLPENVTASRRCFHNHQFLHHIERMPQPQHQRFVVVGAGQSAAEIVDYLHGRYPTAAVHSVFSRFGYSPADDSPYANRIFDPSVVDEFHHAPPDVRNRLLELHRGVNYSVVDPDLIAHLYETEYQERVGGQRRLFMHRASKLVGVAESATGVSATVRCELSELEETLECDAVVFATGFTPTPLRPLLADIVSEPPAVARDYRIITDPRIQAGIYLQGGVEHTHGISSSLLSNVAVRAGEILTSIIQRRINARVLGGTQANQHEVWATAQ